MLAQQKLTHEVMCNGAHVTGIVGCFALYPPNLFFNTYYNQSTIGETRTTGRHSYPPKKSPPEVVAWTLFEV